jgi:FkbM family methyltransferase
MLPLWKLTTARRNLFELFGSTKYSRPAYGTIQQTLKKYLPNKGFFVEAGAVDGFFESNTYYLEKFCGWNGLLIEPIPQMYRRIKYNRPNCLAYNCALTSFDYLGDTIDIVSQHAISKISHNESCSNGVVIKVPARTLSSIFHESKVEKIDFMSLDVEGFELEVLKGMEFDRCRPDTLLVECLDADSKSRIIEFLSTHYDLICEASYRDLLFVAKRKCD